MLCFVLKRVYKCVRVVMEIVLKKRKTLKCIYTSHVPNLFVLAHIFHDFERAHAKFCAWMHMKPLYALISNIWQKDQAKLQNYVFLQHGLDLWSMTLTIELLQDVIKVNSCTKFCDHTSIRSAARVPTDWQTDRQTHRRLRFYNLYRWRGRYKCGLKKKIETKAALYWG